jgi:signal transduction histidine kinase
MIERTRTGPFSEKTIRIFLAVYRGFALILPATLFSLGLFDIYSWPQWCVVGAAAAYTLFKLVCPLCRFKSNILTYTDFGIDLAICFSLPMLTGGLQSPFLLYCLSPLLTSALLFSRKLTFSVAALPLISVIGSQLTIYSSSTVFSFSGLSFGLLGIYLASSLLFAWLPYAMNINASQNILVQAVIEERKRISRDVHDGLSQTLWVIRWKLEQVRKQVTSGNISAALNDLAEVLGKVEYSQQELREFMDQLRSTALHNEQGFVPILAQYTTDFTRDYGIDCELRLTDGKIDLAPLAELELLCIAQEALANVRKHARASKVQVSFETSTGGTLLTIRDNGRGFNSREVGHGHGLAVMEERVKSIGGELYIISNPGGGAEITVKLPPPDRFRFIKG